MFRKVLLCAKTAVSLQRQKETKREKKYMGKAPQRKRLERIRGSDLFKVEKIVSA